MKIEGSPEELVAFLDYLKDRDLCEFEREFLSNETPKKAEKPKAPLKKAETSSIGRPEKGEVSDKMDRILSILNNGKLVDKFINLPELNQLLGIDEKNNTLKQKYKYALDKLVSRGKVNKRKDKENHSIYSIAE